LNMFVISEAAREIIHQHAVQEYPFECCGVIVGKEGESPSGERVHRLTNIQNRLHEEDPENNPRDARTAYQMDPEEFYTVLKGAETEALVVKAIYHSHPENPVYFSREDEEKALIWGEPLCNHYIIISVYAGVVKEEGAFRWEPSSRTFVREEIVRGQ